MTRDRSSRNAAVRNPEVVVDPKARDRARTFYGERLKASPYPQKVKARAMGISPQAVSKHERGEVDSISYDQLRRLALLDLRVALGVVNGARVECESAALSGKSLRDLLALMVPAMSSEQKTDGAEDDSQLQLATTLGTVAFMADGMGLPTRRELGHRLDQWINRTLAHADAAMAAVAVARAIRHKLSPIEEI